MMSALIGGAVIGIAVSMMLIFNGRVTGISGIISGIIKPQKGDVLWRSMFVIGLLLGGVILRIYMPESFMNESSASSLDYALAGLLVGFGTTLGSGCTSGHGVCGISRFSIRSIVATVTFIIFGGLGLFIFKLLKGSL